MALRILLADDSMTAQNMGKKILTDAGFDVVTVSNGAAAVKKIAEASPDIAILDVYMPGYSGLEVCERLKSTPATARVPVLLSVGKMEPFLPEEGMKVRADGVIIKPFEATDLVTVISKLAERTYGPEANTEGVAPSEEAAPEEPEPKAEEALPVEEPAPVRETTAEGLQTFTPVPDDVLAVKPESQVEFTSAPPVGEVGGVQLEDLVPTLQETPEDVPVEGLAADLSPATDELAGIEEISALDAEPVLDTSYAVAEVAEPTLDLPDEGMSDESILPGETAETTDEFDLDLTAAIQDELAAPEIPGTPNLSLDDPAVGATAVQQSAPFLSPLGKTSFDDLDAVMEETVLPGDTDAPVIAEEIPLGPSIADSPEQLVAKEDEIAIPGSDEFLDAMVLDNEVAEHGTSESMTAEPEPTLVQDAEAELAIEQNRGVTGDTEELLDIESDTTPQAVSSDGDATASALAFYGLADEDVEAILHNPAEEMDEPLFSMVEDVPPISQPQTAASEEEPLLTDETTADSTTINLLEDEVTGVSPTLEEAPLVQGDADGSLADESLAPEVVEATPASMEEIVTPVPTPVVPAEPVQAVVAVPVSELPPPAAEISAAQTSTNDSASARNEEMLNGMIERVVDRVVDRLKPVLTIMVEEILAEVKKK